MVRDATRSIDVAARYGGDELAADPGRDRTRRRRDPGRAARASGCGTTRGAAARRRNDGRDGQRRRRDHPGSAHGPGLADRRGGSGPAAGQAGGQEPDPHGPPRWVRRWGGARPTQAAGAARAASAAGRGANVRKLVAWVQGPGGGPAITYAAQRLSFDPSRRSRPRIMGILDDAIREHLDLKRKHGARDAELREIEDEAFGSSDQPDPSRPMSSSTRSVDGHGRGGAGPPRAGGRPGGLGRAGPGGEEPTRLVEPEALRPSEPAEEPQTERPVEPLSPPEGLSQVPGQVELPGRTRSPARSDSTASPGGLPARAGARAGACRADRGRAGTEEPAPRAPSARLRVARGSDRRGGAVPRGRGGADRRAARPARSRLPLSPGRRCAPPPVEPEASERARGSRSRESSRRPSPRPSAPEPAPSRLAGLAAGSTFPPRSIRRPGETGGLPRIPAAGAGAARGGRRGALDGGAAPEEEPLRRRGAGRGVESGPALYDFETDEEPVLPAPRRRSRERRRLRGARPRRGGGALPRGGGALRRGGRSRTPRPRREEPGTAVRPGARGRGSLRGWRPRPEEAYEEEERGRGLWFEKGPPQDFDFDGLSSG